MFGVFLVLTLWQAVVFFTKSYPEHILPVVVALHGTKESVPFAYKWTVLLGIGTVGGLIVSGFGWLALAVRR